MKQLEAALKKRRTSKFNYHNITYAGGPSYTIKHTIRTRASRPGLSHQHNIIHKRWHILPSDGGNDPTDQQPQSSARPIKPPGVTYGLWEPPAYQYTLIARIDLHTK